MHTRVAIAPRNVWGVFVVPLAYYGLFASGFFGAAVVFWTETEVRLPALVVGATFLFFGAVHISWWWARYGGVEVCFHDGVVVVERRGRRVTERAVKAVDSISVGPPFSLLDVLLSSFTWLDVLPTLSISSDSGDGSYRVLLRSDTDVARLNAELADALAMSTRRDVAQ